MNKFLRVKEEADKKVQKKETDRLALKQQELENYFSSIAKHDREVERKRRRNI